jgi:hypothetical protein
MGPTKINAQAAAPHQRLERTRGPPRAHPGITPAHLGSPDGGERRRPTLTRQNGKGNIWSTWFEFCAPPPTHLASLTSLSFPTPPYAQWLRLRTTSSSRRGLGGIRRPYSSHRRIGHFSDLRACYGLFSPTYTFFTPCFSLLAAGWERGGRGHLV